MLPGTNSDLTILKESGEMDEEEDTDSELEEAKQ